VSPIIWSRGTGDSEQIASPDFNHVYKYQPPDCLHYSGFKGNGAGVTDLEFEKRR